MVRVTAAILQEDGKVFIARRKGGKNLAGKWEFPGGKIEAGETPEDSLVRELAEELDMRVSVGSFLCRTTFTEGPIDLELLAYRVTRLGGGPVLREHDAAAWVEPSALPTYDLADSDRRVVEKLFG
jgi:8-oxo-dGTP diphosphatase